MSKSDWGVVVAIGGCLILAALGLNDAQERRYNEQRAKSTRQPTKQIDRNRAGIPRFAERYISNPDPEKGKELERRNLAAQEATTVWAFWAVVVSSFSALITFGGTLLLIKQITLTRRALDETAKATEAMVGANDIAKSNLDATKASTRPVLIYDVKVIDDGWWGSRKQGGLTTTFRVINVGASVAIIKNITARTYCVVHPYNFKDANFTPFAMVPADKVGNEIAYLLPSKETDWIETSSWAPNIQLIGESVAFNGAKVGGLLWFYGVITYEAANGDSHETSVCLNIVDRSGWQFVERGFKDRNYRK